MTRVLLTALACSQTGRATGSLKTLFLKTDHVFNQTSGATGERPF